MGQDATPDPRAAFAPPHTIWLESLDLKPMEQEWREPQIGKSVNGNPLTLGTVVYPHGIGSHAYSELQIDLKGAATRFLADVGVDSEETGHGSVVFSVWLDGKLAATTGVLRGGQPARRLSVDVSGRTA